MNFYDRTIEVYEKIYKGIERYRALTVNNESEH